MKQKKKSRRRALALIRLILLLFLAGAAVLFAAFSPVFNIASIEVKGCTRYDVKEIAALSGIPVGANAFKSMGSSPSDVFRFRFGKAEKIIEEKCAYVKSVKVRLAAPTKVVIEMVERKPEAVVPYLGTSLLIDVEGDVLEAGVEKPDKSLVVVKGLGFDRYQIGKPLPVKEPESLKKAFELRDALKQTDENETDKLAPRLGWIDVGNPGGIIMLLDNRIKVNLGDLQDLNYRLDVTRLVLSRNIKKEDKGMLDFTAGANPVFKPE